MKLPALKIPAITIKSIFRNIKQRALLLSIVLLAPIVLSACGAPQTPPTVLEWWTVFENRQAFGDLIKEYEDDNNVEIRITTFPFATYEDELIRAIAAGRGPDIFSIHNSWLPEHRELLAPIPVAADFASLPEEERAPLENQITELPGLREFVNTYVDVVADDFVSEGRVYAVPLYVDSLALFYNKDLLSTAGFPSPPTTWSKFSEMASALTTKDDQDRIIRAGAAMGAARNINRSTDILSALLIQNGVAAVDSTRQSVTFNREVTLADGTEVTPGLDALTFYTDFTNPTKPNYSWSNDPTIWYSIDNFAASDVAMMINYSHQAPEVRAANAKLNFAVAPLPQADDSRFDVTYANYWGQGVSNSSGVQIDAWNFINYLSRDDNNLTYLQNTRRPPAKNSQIAAFANDLDLGVFADQAQTAKSFYTPDLNLTETVFAQAIEDVNFGRRTPEDAFNVAASQLNQQLLTQDYPPTGI